MSVDENFENIWQKLDQYNTDCRKAERELLSAVQLLSETQSSNYASLLVQLTKGIIRVLQVGGTICITSNDCRYYVLNNRKGDNNEQSKRSEPSQENA